MMKSATTDPITAAIEAAVEAGIAKAIDERIVPLLIDLRESFNRPAEVPTSTDLTAVPQPDRIVSMARACEMLGVNRTTLLRRERKGQIPLRKTFPCGTVGWLKSQWDDYFARATDYQRNPEKNAERAARFH